MSLEETREIILQKEQELSELKNKKKQLYQELKAVLNEDANRKHQQKSEIFASTAYPYPTNGPSQLGSHPQMLFQSGLMAGQSDVHTLIKVEAGGPQQTDLNTSVQQAHHKHPFSVVTPPTAYQNALPYGMKSLPHSAHAVISHPLTGDEGT
ncbi:unnamed protein product, partial [Meganyctiphanes norvegica]